MTTISDVDYALMAGASYISTRPEINQFPAPQGWVGIRHDNPPDGSGFEAISFVPTGTTLTTSADIVISFAGTYDKDITGDVAADVALGAGLLSDQLFQAAEQIKGVCIALLLNRHAQAACALTGEN